MFIGFPSITFIKIEVLDDFQNFLINAIDKLIAGDPKWLCAKVWPQVINLINFKSWKRSYILLLSLVSYIKKLSHLDGTRHQRDVLQIV